MLDNEYKELEKHPDSQIRQDKAAFFEMYKVHLEAIIAECDYYLDRRYEPITNATHRKPKWTIRRDNAKRRRKQIRDNALAYHWQEREGGLIVSWDRDKFMQIAQDRGYFTEEAVTSEVAKELKFDRTRAKVALAKGRFSWGQVLCLGAMFQMTPKEFCDTFLSGYFIDQYGEYRADYENLNKQELLKQVVRTNPLYGIKEDIIDVGADGKPLDEEEWF